MKAPVGPATSVATSWPSTRSSTSWPGKESPWSTSSPPAATVVGTPGARVGAPSSTSTLVAPDTSGSPGASGRVRAVIVSRPSVWKKASPGATARPWASWRTSPSSGGRPSETDTCTNPVKSVASAPLARSARTVRSFSVNGRSCGASKTSSWSSAPIPVFLRITSARRVARTAASAGPERPFS